MRDALVFDVGGSNLRAGKYSFADKRIIDVRKRVTPNLWNSIFDGSDPYGLLIKSMKLLSNELYREAEPEIVTIGFPGPLSPDGNILSTPTIWGSKVKCFAELKESLQSCWPKAKVSIINDVTAAGYFLNKTYTEDFCVITVSSGIGSKLFIDGKPYTGINGRGGEIGHWVIDDSDEALICECGGRGHLGGISSGRGTLAFAKKSAKIDSAAFSNSCLGKLTKGNAEMLTNELLVKSYQMGDAWAMETVNLPAKYLSKAMAMIHTTSGIELFVIIGGFSIALGEPYRRFLVKSAKQYCWKLGQDWNQMIQIGKDDIEMGLIGAGIFSESVNIDITQQVIKGSVPVSL